MSMTRAAIVRAFTRALRELDPAARVEDAIPRAWSSGAAPVRVIAIGKAAPAMAAGAFRRLGDSIERCLVITSDGTDVTEVEALAARTANAGSITVLRASHPLPDARSVRAGRACLAMAAGDARGAGGRLLVLVSGGASALACVPSPGITLRTKRAITRAMLESGASIQDINVVRKHLSRLKGGGLARAAAAARGMTLLTLVASDVVGGTASDVGSGPSVPDDSTVTEARRLLARHAPAFRDVPLVRTWSPAAPGARAAMAAAKIVISPEELARSMAALLKGGESRKVRLLPSSQAPVEVLAAEYVALAERAREPGIYVRAAEPAVTVATSGRGGRSTHLAALVGQRVGEPRLVDARARSSRRIVFAALASDGVDGSSGTGGAIIDDRFASRLSRALGDGALAGSLERFDTGPLHQAAATSVPSKPTGHNLADLHVLVIE